MPCASLRLAATIERVIARHPYDHAGSELFVILMIMQEASYLSLQRDFLLQITDRTGAVEELLLELRGNRIPTHDHGSAQAPQDLLFDLSERGAVVAMLSGLNRPIEMNCHPFLVVGQRRVGLR